MHAKNSSLLHFLSWVILSFWFGAQAFFGFILAPAAFRVLSDTKSAGRLVGATLAPLELYGIAAGICLALLGMLLGHSRFAWLLSLFLSGVCALSHFGVSARLAELRPAAFGPEGEPGAQMLFAQLHNVSLGLFLITSVGTLLLVWSHARQSKPKHYDHT